MTDKRETFTDKCIKDANGRLVLAQRPNAPQLVGWAALLLSWPLSGKAQHVALMVAFGAWFTWAWLELFQGTNYFRRALGTLTLGLLLLIAAMAG